MRLKAAIGHVAQSKGIKSLAAIMLAALQPAARKGQRSFGGGWSPGDGAAPGSACGPTVVVARSPAAIPPSTKVIGELSPALT